MCLTIFNETDETANYIAITNIPKKSFSYIPKEFK
jgi:hypothetical protein